MARVKSIRPKIRIAAQASPSAPLSEYRIELRILDEFDENEKSESNQRASGNPAGTKPTFWSSIKSEMERIEDRIEANLVSQGFSLGSGNELISSDENSYRRELFLPDVIEEMSGAQLRIAMSLGILTIDQLNGNDYAKYLNALRNPVPQGTALNVLDAAADAAEAAGSNQIALGKRSL